MNKYWKQLYKILNLYPKYTWETLHTKILNYLLNFQKVLYSDYTKMSLHTEIIQKGFI